MIGSLEKKIIRILQKEIPVDKEPYKIIAEELGLTEEELLEKINKLHNEGILKRVGAVLRHEEAGIKGNALVVWKVPEEKVENVGNIMSSLQEISHCYERFTCENWRYNMFTMIHGKTREQCDKVIKQVADNTGIYDYRVLYSIKELKKASMKY